MTGLLKPEIKEQIWGSGGARVFRSSKFGTVAGCLVVEGYQAGQPVRTGDNVVIHQVSSIRCVVSRTKLARFGPHRVRHRRAQHKRHPRGRPDRVLRPVEVARTCDVPACRVKFPRGASPSSARTVSNCCGARFATPRLKPSRSRTVRVSPDLSHAWCTTPADRRHARPAAEGDPRRGRALSAWPLGRMLRLRVAPHLHFQPDDELERGNRLAT